MSAHPAPRATRSIRAETAGSSGLALGPNQRGKAGREVEASIPVIRLALTIYDDPLAPLATLKKVSISGYGDGIAEGLPRRPGWSDKFDWIVAVIAIIGILLVLR